MNGRQWLFAVAMVCVTLIVCGAMMTYGPHVGP